MRNHIAYVYVVMLLVVRHTLSLRWAIYHAERNQTNHCHNASNTRPGIAKQAAVASRSAMYTLLHFSQINYPRIIVDVFFENFLLESSVGFQG